MTPFIPMPPRYQRMSEADFRGLRDRLKERIIEEYGELVIPDCQTPLGDTAILIAELGLIREGRMAGAA